MPAPRQVLGVGLGVKAFSRDLSLGPELERSMVTKKIDVRGWVKDWSEKDMTGVPDGQAVEYLLKLENTVFRGVKDVQGGRFATENMMKKKECDRQAEVFRKKI